MKKSKKSGLIKEKVQYKIDRLMEKGTSTMIVSLLVFTLITSCIVGLVATAICGGNPGVRIWDSLMHTLDGGTLAGDDLSSVFNIVLMTIMTIFGLCITAVLIGILNNCLESKLYDMRKGTSKVIEKGHVVILGYSYTIFTLLESLIEANANHPNQCIVVVGDEENEVMQDAIKANIKDFKTTRVICRSGKTYEKYMLERAAVEKARSVIINGRSDTHSVKALLAFRSYLADKESELYNPNLYVSVVIHEKEFVHAARVAGGERAEVVFGKDAISRIIAHSCSQRGLCQVYEELFNYNDNEIYFEKVSDVIKEKTFGDVLHMFEQQIPLGIHRGEDILINPDMGTVLKSDDELLLFEEDDGAYRLSRDEYDIDENAIVKDNIVAEGMMDLIILGQNEKIDDILLEYNQLVKNNAFVRVVDTRDNLVTWVGQYENLEIEYVHVDSFGYDALKSVLDRKEYNVLVLTDDEQDYEDADSETIVELIELHKIANELKTGFVTTCEIQKGSNQKLAEIIGAENFVVGSNFLGLMAIQIAENRLNVRVFKEILSVEGSEVYMRPVENYIKLGRRVNFNTILKAASLKNCIALGYRYYDTITKEYVLVTCPHRNSYIEFQKGDTLIVLAEE